MKLTKEQVSHIAKLARINLTEAEVEKFTNQMGNILGFFEKLNEVDTTGIPETNQVTGMQNVSREDKVVDFEEEEILIACSRNPIVDNQIKVKKSI
jgi:aspartyl-tRNA(Asn)/glutamyl-tRNA(Gln) amidotransferase subunit C